MDKVTLVTVHNAFERTGRDTRAVESGLTLSEIQTLFLPATVEFALSINGQIVDLSTIPRAGDMVVAVPVITGGGDTGKMIGRIIGMVIVAVLSYGVGLAANAGYFGYSAAALAVAQGGIAGGLAAAAVMMVGGLLVNMAFTAPLGGNLPTYGDSATSSPSYGWQPQSTQQQGTTVPKWYGRNLLYGNITVSHITYNGANSYINALINLGLGPFQRLYDFQVNDQPVTNFIGVNTPDVRLGNISQTVLPGFEDTFVEYDTNQLAIYSTPVVYTTQGSDFDELRIGIQFPRGLGYYSDAGSIVTATVDYDILVSPHAANSYKSISPPAGVMTHLNGWAVGYWISGGINKPNIWVDFGFGGPWVNYDNVTYAGDLSETVIEQGAHVVGITATRTITFKYYAFNDTANEWQYQIYNLVAPATPTADAVWHFFNNEDVLVLNYVTSPVLGGFRAIASQTNPLNIIHAFIPSTLGQYDIKVVRVSSDFSNTRSFGELYLASVTEVSHQTFTYPRQVVVGLKALATNQLSGSLRFSCMGECSIIRIWDGTAWSNQYSTNPAWVCYDVLTQPVIPDVFTAPVRYDGIDPSRLDYVKFKEWADYCDELLPDGDGGTEKRVEFNGGFDSEMSLWEAALRITTMAYATPVWNGIKLTIAIDKPADPVQLFSLGNIDQDSFKESFLPMSDRAAEIEVDFVNEENNYQRDKLSVMNANMTTVTSKVNVSMFGITKPSMVWRNAMRKLAYNQLISRTVDFGADIDSIACTIGDVILIQHDVPQWGYGGRIVSATTTSVTIDQTITLVAGTQYAILVRMGDDSLVERDITSAAGDHTALTVSPAFTTAPVQFDVFTVGEILKTAKPFRVSNISRASDLKAQISSVEYMDGVYAPDYDLPITAGLDYSQPLRGYKQSLPPLEDITGVVVLESQEGRNGNQIDTIATIYWTPVVNRYAFPAVEVWAWQDGAAPVKIATTTANYFEWTVPIEKTWWNFAVACVNLNGETQNVNNLTPVRQFINGKSAPPAVDFFSVFRQPNGIRQFDWHYFTTPPFIAGYRIEYAEIIGGVTGVYVPLHNGLLTNSPYETNQLAAGTYSFNIYTVDITGQISIPFNITATLGTPNLAGVTLAIYPHLTGWTGTKTNCYVDEFGQIVSTDQKTWASFPTDFVTWDNWKLWARNPNLSITYEQDGIDLGSSKTVTPNINAISLDTLSIQVQYSTDNSSWSSWGVPAQVTARYFKVKITATSASGSAVINAAYIYF